ncbi:MAG TPA: hypothetical protein VME46_09395 [Acidimicrobiales bacterium]|nr:hypothetical protein [Acidimicrobiales bacterium]
MASDFDVGLLVGVLIGEGHFGGDGRQPHVTLRMHVRHEALFEWITRTFPGGRLYGPYSHADRQYYQWMARGAYLRESLLPLLDRHLTPTLDRHAYQRYQEMKTRYGRHFLPVPDEAVPDQVARDEVARDEGAPHLAGANGGEVYFARPSRPDRPTRVARPGRPARQLKDVGGRPEQRASAAEIFERLRQGRADAGPTSPPVP